MEKKINCCVIISGAPEKELDYYCDYISDSFIISADSGYLKCLELGIIPDLIIGDFDSSDKPDTDIETIILPTVKDDTDTFFAVKEAIRRGFDDITILGGIGSRFDHTYSNVLCLNYCIDNNVRCALINKSNKLIIINDKAQLKRGEYKYFSIFPLFSSCDGVTINGACYNLENRLIHPSEQYTQSNEFKDDTVSISIKSGKLLIVLSND